MIGSFGEVLVLDWGVARRSADPAEPGGTILGTRAYMSPEQAEGRNDRVDGRADVYSLGVLLAELLGQDREPALAAVAARAKSPEPDQRYSRVEELSADVGRFLDGQAPLAYRESLLGRAGRFFRKYRTAILLIAAYLLMRAAILLFLGR
jgi:serine/threonine protein kinase